MNERRRFLVVVRCGDASFHPGWLAAEGANRNWDLHLSYFGSVPDRYAPEHRGESMSFEKGSKYFGLFDYIEAHLEEIKQYDYIALPDDDLQLTAGDWSTAFTLMEQSGASLAQPSLDRRSYFAHDLALRRHRFLYRQVDFVEVMAPMFKVDFLLEIYSHFKLNNSSWGLDYIWSKMTERAGRTLAVIDAACFLHTRRVGKGGQYGGRAMDGLYDELNAAVKKYDVKIWIGQASAAWTTKGKSKEPLFLINRLERLPRVYKLVKDLMAINVITL